MQPTIEFVSAEAEDGQLQRFALVTEYRVDSTFDGEVPVAARVTALTEKGRKATVSSDGDVFTDHASGKLFRRIR